MSYYLQNAILNVLMRPQPENPVFDLRSTGVGTNFPTPGERTIEDRSWSWHMNDIVVYDPVTSRTYVGSQLMFPNDSLGTDEGAQVVDIFNADGGFVSTVVVADLGRPGDDHNAATLGVFNGRLYCGTAGHAGPAYIYQSTDTTPENFTTSGAGGASIGSGTYIQFTESNGRFFCAIRNSVSSWRMYELTDESTNAWTLVNRIASSANQTYINLRSTATELRFIAWNHPVNNSNRGPIKARAFQPGDPTIPDGSLGVIYDPPLSPDTSTRTLSVTPDASAILFAEFDLPFTNGDTETYYVLRYDGVGAFDDPSSWSRETVGTNQYAFYSSSHYIPGGCFGDRDGNILWLCEAAVDGTTTVKYGTRDVDTGVWSFQTLGTSAVTLARPFSDFDTRGQTFIQRLESYPSFSNMESNLVLLYRDDMFVEDDFAIPLPEVPGLRRRPELFEYFDTPDLDVFTVSPDLTKIQTGDLIIVSLAIGSAGPAVVAFGPHMLVERVNSGSSRECTVHTLEYDEAMGIHDITVTTSSPASYQKLVVHLAPKGAVYDSAAAGDIPYSDGEFVVALALTFSGAGIDHTYTPDTKISQENHGSSTVISYGAGLLAGSGTFSIDQSNRASAIFTGLSATPSLPEQVGNLVVVSVVPLQTSLTWSKPFDGNSDITDYIIEVDINGGGFNTIADGIGDNLFFTHTGLVAGATYTYRVSAVNGVGTGPASASDSAVVKDQTPDQVVNLLATSSPNQADLTWDAPADNGFPITDYIIEVSIEGGPFNTIADGVNTNTFYTHTGLTNGLLHEYRVSAVNSVGTGEASQVVGTTPGIITDPPDQVDGLVVIPGDTQVDLSWDEPADNNSTIFDYIIEVNIDGAGFVTLADGIGTSTSYVHTGLTNDLTHEYRVSAVNGEGTGPASVAVTTIPYVPVPGGTLLSPVVGLQSPPELAEYFSSPDIDEFVVGPDLSAANDGDVIVVSAASRLGGAPAMSVGGFPLNKEGEDGTTNRASVFSITYTRNMGNRFVFSTPSSSNYQKLLFCIVPAGRTVQAVGTEGLPYQDNDLLVGIGFSTNSSSAAHAWSPDIRVDRTLHGSSTIISYGAGLVSGVGNQAISATQQSQVVALR